MHIAFTKGVVSGRVPFDQKLIPVRISEIFVRRMEWYFPPGRTRLVLFPLEHVSHQELLDKMLKDCDEVAVLGAVSWLMLRSLTRIQTIYSEFNSSLIINYERNLRTFLAGEYANPGPTNPQEIRND